MKPTSVAALFTGAIAGVAAMYLLDPDQGERRRRMIASKAEGYWDDASDVLHDQWNNLSSHARDMGQHGYSAAQDYASGLLNRVKNAAGDVQSHAQSKADDATAYAANYAHGWLDQGRKWLHGYRDQAMDYRDQAMKMAPHSMADAQNLAQQYGQAAWDRARKIGWRAHDRAMDAVIRGRAAIGPKQTSPVVPVAVTAMSFLALGAGAMYIVDPQKGRSRRAWISDKVHSFIRRSGNTAYSKGRHIANKAYGMAHEAGDAASDLVDRVNKRIGEIMQDPRVVKVMADANGTITLAGKVMHDQIARLIAAVDSIPGVTQVINKLEAIAGKTSDSQSPAHEVH